MVYSAPGYALGKLLGIQGIASGATLKHFAIMCSKR